MENSNQIKYDHNEERTNYTLVDIMPCPICGDDVEIYEYTTLDYNVSGTCVTCGEVILL